MEKTKILNASGIIDFYINKDKFLAYKTKKAQFNYAYRELNNILKLNIGNNINNIDIRDISITSNNFWGIDEFCIINDIGYSFSNLLELNNEFITLRIFKIDILGLLTTPYNTSSLFDDIKGLNYCISISSIKIV